MNIRSSSIPSNVSSLAELFSQLASQANIQSEQLAAVFCRALKGAISDSETFARGGAAGVFRSAAEALERLSEGRTATTEDVATSQIDWTDIVRKFSHDVNNALTPPTSYVDAIRSDLSNLVTELTARSRQPNTDGRDPVFEKKILEALVTLVGDIELTSESIGAVTKLVKALQDLDGKQAVVPQTAQPPAPSVTPQLASTLGAPTLLVVDDESQNCRAVKRALSQEGFGKILTIGNAEKALELLATPQGAGVQIVLTDFNMLRMNGLELAREIRRMYPQVATVIYSGNPKELTKAMGDDRFPFVEKPFDTEKLVQTLMTEHERASKAVPVATPTAAAITGALLLVEKDGETLRRLTETLSPLCGSLGISITGTDNAKTAIDVFRMNSRISVVMTGFSPTLRPLNSMYLIAQLWKTGRRFRSLVATDEEETEMEEEDVVFVKRPLDPEKVRRQIQAAFGTTTG